jgi:hypothetical protein
VVSDDAVLLAFGRCAASVAQVENYWVLIPTTRYSFPETRI